jgi:hypothetical protein
MISVNTVVQIISVVTAQPAAITVALALGLENALICRR